MNIIKRILLMMVPVFVLAAILLTSSPAFSQSQLQPILTDPRMVVIPSRSIDDVSADIDNATVSKQLALDRKAQAEYRLKESQQAIESRKGNLKDTARREKDARKGKRESEAIALKIESKASQQAIDLLNRLKDLRKAEVDEADAEADLADIEIKAFGLEKELQGKRIEYNSLTSSAGDELSQKTAQQVIGELEVRLLKIQQDQAAAAQKVAAKQKDVVSRRMRLHQAQLKLGMPKP
jgi:hypothetical protein